MCLLLCSPLCRGWLYVGCAEVVPSGPSGLPSGSDHCWCCIRATGAPAVRGKQQSCCRARCGGRWWCARCGGPCIRPREGAQRRWLPGDGCANRACAQRRWLPGDGCANRACARRRGVGCREMVVVRPTLRARGGAEARGCREMGAPTVHARGAEAVVAGGWWWCGQPCVREEAQRRWLPGDGCANRAIARRIGVVAGRWLVGWWCGRPVRWFGRGGG